MERALWLTRALVAVVLLAAAGLWWGWRHRGRRQSDLPELPAVPQRCGADLIEPLTGLYVSTHHGRHWQDRIVAHGSGSARGGDGARWRAEGVLIDRIGDDPIFIPVADLRRSRHRARHRREGDGPRRPESWCSPGTRRGRSCDSGVRADDLDDQRDWLVAAQRLAS